MERHWHGNWQKVRGESGRTAANQETHRYSAKTRIDFKNVNRLKLNWRERVRTPVQNNFFLAAAAAAHVFVPTNRTVRCQSSRLQTKVQFLHLDVRCFDLSTMRRYAKCIATAQRAVIWWWFYVLPMPMPLQIHVPHSRRIEHCAIEIPFELGDHVQQFAFKLFTKHKAMHVNRTKKIVHKLVLMYDVRRTSHIAHRQYNAFHFCVRDNWFGRYECVRSRAPVCRIQIKGKWTEKPAIIKQFIRFSFPPARAATWMSRIPWTFPRFAIEKWREKTGCYYVLHYIFRRTAIYGMRCS